MYSSNWSDERLEKEIKYQQEVLKRMKDGASRRCSQRSQEHYIQRLVEHQNRRKKNG